MSQFWHCHNHRKEKIIEGNPGDVSLRTIWRSSNRSELWPKGDALSVMCKVFLVAAPVYYFFPWNHCHQHIRMQCLWVHMASLTLPLGIDSWRKSLTKWWWRSFSGFCELARVTSHYGILSPRLLAFFASCQVTKKGYSTWRDYEVNLLEWGAGSMSVSWTQTLPSGRKVWTWRQREPQGIIDGRREFRKSQRPRSRNEHGNEGSERAAQLGKEDLRKHIGK